MNTQSSARACMARRAERALREDAVASAPEVVLDPLPAPAGLAHHRHLAGEALRPGSAIDLTITVPFGNRRFLPRGLLA